MIFYEKKYYLWNNIIYNIFLYYFLDCEIELDKRQLERHFKDWLSKYLNIEPSTYSIYKHYSENDVGYLYTTNDNETIKDAFMTVDHVNFL